ncbi:MAG: alkaline phosphatase [Acidobacteria bacterium]|nr:MAG: alkaline phosphatase [Acidobacteriota bacterium]
MKKTVLLTLLLTFISCGTEERHARNVILFIGDAGGLSVLTAAALHKGRPQSLFIHRMAHHGLMDTSSTSDWNTDSAAGMTAIVTGYKTNDGVISQSADAVRGQKDGKALKTILEYAEEKGLSTGVITDNKVAGATPGACYAHSNNRSKTAEIFLQLLSPLYGDGVDLLIGPEDGVLTEASANGQNPETDLRAKGYAVAKSLDQFKPTAQRAVVLLPTDEFDRETAVRRTIDILSRNPKGYFLMVEVDVHTDKLRRGLERVLVLDRLIEQTVKSVPEDTLVIFAADHSFDTQIVGGGPGQPLLPPDGAGDTDSATADPAIRVGDGHSGEDVLVAAQGPGAERVKGFFPNTQLFRIMMAAYGWEETKAPQQMSKVN